MSSKEFNHVEFSEKLFKKSDLLAIQLIKVLTNNLFFNDFMKFKVFIKLQHNFNEIYLSSLINKNNSNNLDFFINSVQSHSATLQSDLKKFHIDNKKFYNQKNFRTHNELIGWLYVYFFCDYFSSFYFKEVNTITEECSTQKYLMTETFYKKQKWNLFNNFLNRNYFDESDQNEIINSIKKHSIDYLNTLSEKNCE